MRSSPEVTLPLDLRALTVLAPDQHGAHRPHGGASLPARIVAELRRLITETVLAPGDALPSTRALAGHLGVSRGTVVAAYDQLLAEGYLTAAAGRSTIVNPQLRRVHPQPGAPLATHHAGPPAGVRSPLVSDRTLDLRPGEPWADDVVGPAWKAAWRQASITRLDAELPPLGLPALRDAWAEHLRRMRAVVRDPGQIAVTGGGREGLALLLLALADGRPTTLRVGVEDPGYPSLRKVPARLGASVIGMPADERGLRTDALPTGAPVPDVIIVTPSHQYPLGGTLPIDRRQALLDWAGRHGVVVVEDDYDSELRYTSEPLPALAALDDPDDGRVVLLGTLSKVLTPALATGFLALPAWLAPRVADVRTDLGQPVGLVPQRAAAHYLASGALRLHTQRMRNRYRRRRAQVVAALAHAPGLRVYPMDGGLHAVVETTRPEADVVAELAASGVRVAPLSQYWSDAASSGIVFGFGAASEPDLTHGLTLIAAVADRQTGGRRSR